MVKLDQTDRKILQVLQDFGRITNVELASQVGISAPPCLRRVRALEEAGIIKGYHADIEGERLGYEVTVFAMIKLHHLADSDLKAFQDLIEPWPYVRECHMLNGDIDFVLKIVAPDLPTFQKFLTEKLTSAPNVESIKTSFLIRTSKDLPGVPID